MLKREKRRNATMSAALKKAGVDIPEPGYDPEELVTDRPVNASQVLTGILPNGSEALPPSEVSQSRPSSRHRARHQKVLSHAGGFLMEGLDFGVVLLFRTLSS
eukprot:m.92225 g.92225  ORF g.92225 m.92225 type:complete len:103 (+) comp36724_c0_seq3:1596-1904(+)